MTFVKSLCSLCCFRSFIQKFIVALYKCSNSLLFSGHSSRSSLLHCTNVSNSRLFSGHSSRSSLLHCTNVQTLCCFQVIHPEVHCCTVQMFKLSVVFRSFIQKFIVALYKCSNSLLFSGHSSRSSSLHCTNVQTLCCFQVIHPEVHCCAVQMFKLSVVFRSFIQKFIVALYKCSNSLLFSGHSSRSSLLHCTNVQTLCCFQVIHPEAHCCAVQMFKFSVVFRSFIQKFIVAGIGISYLDCDYRIRIVFC